MILEMNGFEVDTYNDPLLALSNFDTDHQRKIIKQVITDKIAQVIIINLALSSSRLIVDIVQLLLSVIQKEVIYPLPEEKGEMLLNWSEDSKNNYAGIREFAKKISSQWFREKFCKDGFCGPKYGITNLRTDFGSWTFFFEFEYEKYEAALLYAYWLVFSGMALVYADETINFTKKMKVVFWGRENVNITYIF